VEIHPFTEVTGIDVVRGRVEGVTTSRGRVTARVVVNATAGWASTVAAMAGVRLPIVTHPLQALVTEPLKPFLDKVIVSATYHVYITQTDRGELVIGQEIDPYSSYSQRSTLPFMETAARHAIELFPCIAGVKVLRQWAGICDMTPDFAPIMSTVPDVEGFIVDVGWGTYGFKAAPAAGYRIAELIATGQTPSLIAPFSLDRFAKDRLLGEKAAAAVSH
jgi:sarcosine oxidase subunit beta